VIAFNPLHARILSDAGYTSEKLQEHIFRNCRIAPEDLSGRRTVLRRGEHGIEVFAVDGKIPFTNKAEQIMIVVTGSMAGGHSCYLPNGHFGYAGSKAIAD